jgi:hypothetical protein
MAAITSGDLLVCTACGTQFEEQDSNTLTSCRICDDRPLSRLRISCFRVKTNFTLYAARQFVPPTGQSFTTLKALYNSTSPKYVNKHKTLDADDRFISLWTEPKFGIGQRAILIRTPSGNVLWDLIAYLDDETITWIKSIGGLKGIVISHPHYYTTHVEWAKIFNCPVYFSKEDEEWLNRRSDAQKFIEKEEIEIAKTGVMAIKLGGHFPGSLVCLYDGRLLIADTLLMTPAGVGNWKDKPRPNGMNSFAFMWSIPNVRRLGCERRGCVADV